VRISNVPIFCQKKLTYYIFNVILEVAFEIFHTNQELVLNKQHFKHNICKS